MRRLLYFAPLLALLLGPSPARAHCDTVDGPVAADARKALSSGQVQPVLKWVRAADEAAVRSAFDEARRVRSLSPEAREMADRYFLETLVRVHRAGEGFPYTGLKPAGSVDPILVAADESLETGNVDPLVGKLTNAVAGELKSRFAKARAARVAAGEDVAKGREAVAAYVEYLHYLEGLHGAVHGEAHHEK